VPIRLALLRAIAAALGPARTEPEVADAVLDAVATYLDAVAATLWLVTPDGTELELAYQRNAHPDVLSRFARLSVDRDLPGPQVLRTGEPCFISSAEERDARWHDLAGTPSPSQAMVVLPLEAGDRRVGVVSFGFADHREFDREDRVAFMAVADQCAIALDRARLYEAARADADANHLLARISGLIGRSRDWTVLAGEAAEACIEGFVDTCGVYIREGDLVRRVAMASRTYAEFASDIVDHFPTPLSAEAPTAIAIRTGQPVQVPPITPELLAAASPAPGWRERLGEVDIVLGDAWVVPLQDGTRAFGAMLFTPRHGEVLDAGRLQLAHQVAARTAALLHSATVFAQQRATIETLHEVLLPITLPQLDGLEVAASYVPHGEGSDVGGDWWDALVLPDGRLGLTVGDVAGHGVPAAAVMGQLRNALRVHLVGGSGPAAALAGLSRLLAWTHPAAHATAVAAILDNTTGELELAMAGHPPPVLLDVDGGCRLLETTPAPPLGILRSSQPDDDFPTVRTTLPPGAALLLYTDGLVEGRHRDLDTGFAALMAAAELLREGGLQAACDRLVAKLVDLPEDDICLLVIRRAG
jgi:serine phosphatase RsbU (regulator of sigma subunit)